MPEENHDTTRSLLWRQTTTQLCAYAAAICGSPALPPERARLLSRLDQLQAQYTAGNRVPDRTPLDRALVMYAVWAAARHGRPYLEIAREWNRSHYWVGENVSIVAHRPGRQAPGRRLSRLDEALIQLESLFAGSVPI